MKGLGSGSYLTVSSYEGRRRLVPLFGALLAIAAPAAEPIALCGSHARRAAEEVHLARQASEARSQARISETRALRRTAGEIALLDTGGGVLGARNPFDLAGRTIAFRPVSGPASRYRVETTGRPYAPPAVGAETLRLNDDDTVRVTLPFPFVFFGEPYRELWVNSDGNVTFGEGDGSSSARSAGQFAGGPPRIAALYRDLDPSVAGAVRVEAGTDVFTISWAGVPEYRSFGIGPPQTFQLRLLTNGGVEIAFADAATDAAIVGIAPGDSRRSLDLVALDRPVAGEFGGAVGETFEQTPAIDVVRASQRFLEAFGDAYDYVFFFNDFGLRPGNAIAFQVPVRVAGSGYGLPREDLGRAFGSARRLQSVVNMGPLSQYPEDPAAPLPGRAGTGDNVLTVIAHEAGHQYLAFARLPGLLGRQQAHWSFYFNSDASLLEGNRIVDNGEAARPRFQTTAAVAGYSALDRYLMGWGALAEVPGTFFVEPFFVPFRPEDAPATGVLFDGRRVDVEPAQISTALGRRTPGYSVAQRRYRMAFVLISTEGREPSAAALAQVERYRREFGPYFRQAAGGRAEADLTLRYPVRASAWPAAGIALGESARVTVELPSPAATPMVFRIASDSAAVGVPATVTMAAGASSVSFRANGLAPGRAALIVEPADPQLETVEARIAVTEPRHLRLTERRSGGQIEVRVSDENALPYPGLRLVARVAGSGTVTPLETETDLSGVARFTGGADRGHVEITAGGGAVIRISGAPLVESVLNAASLEDRIAPGSIVSVFGAGLAGRARVRVEGAAAALLREDAGQLLIALPDGPAGAAAYEVETERGVASGTLRLIESAPAIFVDGATGRGAISANGQIRDFRADEAVEMYATGLRTGDAVGVDVSGREARVRFVGPVPGVLGLWQINFEVPASLPAGTALVMLRTRTAGSNTVLIGIASGG